MLHDFAPEIAIFTLVALVAILVANRVGKAKTILGECLLASAVIVAVLVGVVGLIRSVENRRENEKLKSDAAFSKALYSKIDEPYRCCTH